MQILFCAHLIFYVSIFQYSNCFVFALKLHSRLCSCINRDLRYTSLFEIKYATRAILWYVDIRSE